MLVPAAAAILTTSMEGTIVFIKLVSIYHIYIFWNIIMRAYMSKKEEESKKHHHSARQYASFHFGQAKIGLAFFTISDVRRPMGCLFLAFCVFLFPPATVYMFCPVGWSARRSHT